MKKAKEYAAEFLAEDLTSEEALGRVVKSVFVELFTEAKALMEKRQVSTDAGAVAVFREQEKKWIAMTRLLRAEGLGIKYAGFRDLARANSPEFVDRIEAVEDEERYSSQIETARARESQ